MTSQANSPQASLLLGRETGKGLFYGLFKFMKIATTIIFSLRASEQRGELYKCLSVSEDDPEHPEVISNEELWEWTKQIRTEESIMRRKWKWIGHTLRKPQNNITRCALEWNPQGSRRRGRPKQSWKRSVIAELAKNKITWIEAKRTASNRVRWRSMVDALYSPLGAKMT